jgi:hypothetical protein
MRAESRSPLFLIPLEYRERLDMSPENALICLFIMPGAISTPAGLNWRGFYLYDLSCLLPQPSTTFWEPRLPSYLISALTVACALFMENLDSTIRDLSAPVSFKVLAAR